MEQAIAEKQLTVIYLLSAIFGSMSSITSGIAWGHWKQTLDQCIGRNCSCILYGKHTPSVFLGGDMAPCVWVTFGPLFFIFFAVCMTCFHGYRVLFTSKSTRTKTLMTRNEAGETVQMHTVQAEDISILPRPFWITLSVFTVFFLIYSLIHFAIFIDGYYKTCNQYRKTLEKLLGIHGTAIPVIHGRLSCHAIFDFMDYMQPDSGNAFRDGFINTGLDLILGINGAFFSWCLFSLASFINIKMARTQY